MVRPLKEGVDYFPLDVNPDDKVKLLEAKHKITGFYLWVKLLQKIYATGFWLEWTEDIIILFSNEVNVNINEVNEVINSCLHWKIFDKRLFDDYSILTSHGIQKRFFEITSRRKKIDVVSEYLLVDIDSLDNINLVNASNNSINDDDSTQRKVKKSKKKGKDTLKPDSVSDQIWNDWLIIRKDKKLPLTQTALNGVIKQAEMAGLTLEQAIKTSCENGWAGFKADWLKNKQPQSTDDGTEKARRKLERTQKLLKENER